MFISSKWLNIFFSFSNIYVLDETGEKNIGQALSPIVYNFYLASNFL